MTVKGLIYTSKIAREVEQNDNRFIAERVSFVHARSQCFRFQAFLLGGGVGHSSHNTCIPRFP